MNKDGVPDSYTASALATRRTRVSRKETVAIPHRLGWCRRSAPLFGGPVPADDVVAPLSAHGPAGQRSRQVEWVALIRRLQRHIGAFDRDARHRQVRAA